MKNLVLAAAILASVLASVSLAHDTRAFLPMPGGYLTRLHALEGWQSRGYYGLNCSGYIALAHGSPYREAAEMYEGSEDLPIVAEYATLAGINEADLRPGDVAAFEGHFSIRGIHVAAYLGNGLWADGDSRRGDVAEYRLQDKSPQDSWFQGRVRILRWRD